MKSKRRELITYKTRAMIDVCKVLLLLFNFKCSHLTAQDS